MISQSIKMAWKSITANKLRSFLTMLGIIIGVVALVVLVSLVNGATESVTSQISNMGTSYLNVMVLDDKGKPMKLEDVESLKSDPDFSAAAPSASSSLTVRSTYTEETATVYGTTGDYADIQGLSLYRGRFLKNVDVENHSNVAVINAGIAIDVMGRMDVVGESITINNVSYLIIGVLEADDSDSLTTQDYEAYIPYTSLIRLTDDVSTNVSMFYVTAADESDMDAAEEHLEDLMMERFDDDEDAFAVINQSVVADAMESVTSTLSLLLGGIAAISLLVGGIGIMNIMLVSVTERTREIGIRKAVGARRGDIMLQFLIEALVVSLMGCLIGIALSWLILMVVSGIGGMSFGLSFNVILIAVVFSVAVGVIFGLYPANKAAKEKPIDALRYTG